jgi:hypothetical protein
MMVKDLLESRESRSEHTWNLEASGQMDAPNVSGGEYGLVNKAGKFVRKSLTKAAANALCTRSDLIAKHGPLKVRQISEAVTGDSREEYDHNAFGNSQGTNFPHGEQAQDNIRTLNDNTDGEYGLATGSNKLIRRELTKRAAIALSNRPDLISKYGKLYAVKMD